MMRLLPRTRYLEAIRHVLAHNPVCALLGPRQCGKTTLARQIAAERRSTFFDLESEPDRARLATPETVLSSLSGLVVIDEIQRQPELYTVLRPLVDRPGSRTRFLVLGSAAPELVRGVSESLAGRIGYVDLAGFNLTEIDAKREQRLWLRGAFPRSFLARTDADSLDRREELIRAFLERDLPLLGIRVAAETLRRFWNMLAHYHAQTWNGSELARALGVNEHTARHYLDLLTGGYMVRQLQPWFTNIAKRQTKSPKIYLRDSGILHALLRVHNWYELMGHPKRGASWEGFALEQILNVTGARNAYFWGTHAGAELDLLLFRGGKQYGVEFKTSEGPVMTKSLHIALKDLQLERAWIIYPGVHTYPVHEKVEVTPLAEFLSKAAKMRFR